MKPESRVLLCKPNDGWWSGLVAWFVQSRRLVREYEKITDSTEAMIHLTMIRMLVRRLAPDFSD